MLYVCFMYFSSFKILPNLQNLSENYSINVLCYHSSFQIDMEIIGYSNGLFKLLQFRKLLHSILFLR